MNFVEFENKHYVLATSSFADQRTMILKEGESFAIFDWHGDIHQLGAGKQGIYHDGTRYVSQLAITINGNRPLLLSSRPREDNQLLRIDMTNLDLVDGDEVIMHGSIHLQRSKFLWESTYHERIRLINFGLEPANFDLEMSFDADFADIFEVRGSVRPRKGKIQPVQHQHQYVVFSYVGLDNVVRKTLFHLDPIPDSITDKSAVYHIRLDPKEERALFINIGLGPEVKDPGILTFERGREELNIYMERASRHLADVSTSNDQFNEWLNRSKSDLITMTTVTPHGLYPYAGVPWYSTPFGRDGIITAMECLWVSPDLAKGVLQYLADTQAQHFDDFQDAEPGKIFHETRGGEMAALGETPFKLYYGTIDATPLFISLAGAYLERTHDVKTISKIWPNIERALYWIDNYGDIDGDGFIEYKTKSAKGLLNQGWKDSNDSIFYDNGSLAKDPIALCEVQGYVYDAKVRASEMATVLGHHDLAERLLGEAEQLKREFNDKFWSETRNTYVIALDGNKNQCNVATSNAGHCLFSGIATAERARLVARNLLGESMFSGWGIRTVSSEEIRYNPMSYHNGSIWPHDNAMIAFGLSRYHLMHEAGELISAMFDTAYHMPGQRLPELFCGFPREKGKAPTSYPVACSPQAWAIGSVFLMLQACLGLRIDARKNAITLNHPKLPSFLHDITITNLRMNNKLLVIQVRRDKQEIEAVALSPHNDVTVEVKNHSEVETALQR